ncbi:MAG TPA: CBS domain-containing protein [Candidatus Krumholzibacteria bacterium]
MTKMTTVKDILDRKGRDVHCIPPHESVYRALEVMARHDVGALVVTDRDQLVGVMSERDYARKIALMGRASAETTVRDIMTRDVYCITPRTRIEDCMALMTDKRIRHLPVMDGEHLDGIVSIGDVVKATMHDQEFVIDQLEHFIAGW